MISLPRLLFSLLLALIFLDGFLLLSIYNNPVSLDAVRPSRQIAGDGVELRRFTTPEGTASPTLIVSKALFSPTRELRSPEQPRPVPSSAPLPVKANEPPAPVSDPKPEFVLRGVLFTVSLQKALIASDSTGKQQWFEINDEVYGWRFVEIQEDAVIVEKDTTKVLLQLFVEKAE